MLIGLVIVLLVCAGMAGFFGARAWSESSDYERKLPNGCRVVAIKNEGVFINGPDGSLILVPGGGRAGGGCGIHAVAIAGSWVIGETEGCASDPTRRWFAVDTSSGQIMEQLTEDEWSKVLERNQIKRVALRDPAALPR